MMLIEGLIKVASTWDGNDQNRMCSEVIRESIKYATIAQMQSDAGSQPQGACKLKIK